MSRRAPRPGAPNAASARILTSLMIAVTVGATLSPAATAAAVPTWAPLPGAPQGPGRHEDLFFIDSATGWVVNLAGQVHQTRDGGATWKLLFHSDSLRFRSVGFADSLRGWAGTLYTKAPLYETFDGGRSWTAVPGMPASVHGICGLSVADDSTVYAAGAYYKTSPLLKTTDRGLSWQPIDLGARAKALIDVRFFDRDSGFVTGGLSTGDDAPLDSLRAVVLFTGDGGASWETRHRSDSPGSWGWKFSFPTRRHGFVSIERQRRSEGMVLKTTNGGMTWTEKKFAAQSDLQGIGFVDSARGWAGSHNASYVTEDGGESWAPFSFLGQGNGGNDAVNRIRVPRPGLGYAVGSTVLKYSVSPANGLSRPARPGRAHALVGPGRAEFRGRGEIAYRLSAPAWVSLEVFDGRGRRVRAVRRARMPAGGHLMTFDASGLAPGAYLYRLRVGEALYPGEMRVLP